ncbi:MAG: putative MFS-type transporter [Firmicutes bacterium]|nr:putative MFS-type transporter [Bacillota bacterium]MDI6705933.1 DUF1576 domain-containing protein [Bacillota bacterium]
MGRRDSKFIFMAVFSISLIAFGFIVDTPEEILHGIVRILVESDILISDYIGIGGIGAAFVNSGLLTLIFTMLLHKLEINFNGPAFASLFIVAGFALFGKNLFNVWFIVLGVYLYARFHKDKFSKYIYIALFGTTLAPIVTEIILNTSLPMHTRLPLGLFTGMSIGFLLPPLSTYLLRVHQGFNLYNIGFTGGLIGTIYVSVFKSYGLLPNSRVIWTTGNNALLGIFLAVLFFIMIALGIFMDRNIKHSYKNILGYSGRLVSDFVLLEGFGPSLVNMGICGLIGTIYIVIIGGDLNGPTIGGIFTIVGFGGFGKHPKNILPIFAGVFLGSITKIWGINDPSIQLAALFGTALAPIAGEFGWYFGVLAGFLHSSVVLNVGVLHEGLNLYNNGFAAGIVAAFLVPIIQAFRKDESDEA